MWIKNIHGVAHEIREEVIPSEREKEMTIPKVWDILMTTVVLVRTCQELVHICNS